MGTGRKRKRFPRRKRKGKREVEFFPDGETVLRSTFRATTRGAAIESNISRNDIDHSLSIKYIDECLCIYEKFEDARTRTMYIISIIQCIEYNIHVYHIHLHDIHFVHNIQKYERYRK